jgi:hypothetical protein
LVRVTIWLPRLSPTRAIAVAMLVVAAVGVVLWQTTDGLRAWIPNITVGAVTVALTITVVERAIRREARSRLEPRVDGAISTIGVEFQMMLLAVVRDYSSTHVDAFEPVPKDGVEMIELWLDSHDDIDAPRVRSDDGEVPALVSSARVFADHLERARERDRDVLEPALIRAMDDFCLSVEEAKELVGFELEPAEHAQAEDLALIMIVMSLRVLAWVMSRQGPHWLEIREPTRAAAVARRENARRRRDATVGFRA